MAFGILFVVSQPPLWGLPTALWYPPAGIGFVLVAWCGWRGVAVIIAGTVLAGLLATPADAIPLSALFQSLMLGAEAALGWGCYSGLAGGSRRINDPRSATSFLLIAPGAVALGTAALRTLGTNSDQFLGVLGYEWLSHALAVLVIAPPLLVLVTPVLANSGLIARDSREASAWVDPYGHIATGDALEMFGLALGGGLLGMLLTRSYLTSHIVDWPLWAILLLLVVWSSLRQGLPGGSLSAVAAAFAALCAAGAPAATGFSPLQGHLLALASTALLVGASSGWIRASELRYRQVVGHIPVVLYSARIVRQGGPGKPPEAQVLLVSAACGQVLGCTPAEVTGPHERWLQRVHPEDRELVAAALAQVGRQHGNITCEYRLNPELVRPAPDTDHGRGARTPLPHQLNLPPRSGDGAERWVRDTLAPTYDATGKLVGWEGVVEDITTPRRLAHDLQRASTMLHTLVANLPAGVFFVHGPLGLPLLVNTRARHLLGQREDPSAGVAHLPRTYRLYRPDGTLYAVQELPVYRALFEGVTSMRDDIVIHRPDGRMVPLITWAAPIELGGGGKIEAAVWVFEDLTALHQAEASRLDSEARLRTIIEAMAEGLVIQDADGTILECNPAACAILGRPRERLLGRPALGPDQGWVREDGTPLPPEQHPDALCRRQREPVRNVVVGVTHPGEGGHTAVRWMLMNAVPLSTGQTARAGFLHRTIVTIADVTASRRMLSDLERVQRLETTARLASGVVHDFNNLLTAILCLSQMARMRLQPGDPLLPDLETIQSAAEEAGRLAAQLLSFSRQQKKSLRPTDPNQAIVRTLELLRNSLPDNIAVETDLSAEPIHVLADEGQLQQIVMNLCLNARDAMPHGGRLTVTTRLEAAPNGAADPAAPPYLVRLSVGDTGLGIDAKLKGQVFAPFFSTKERGTGLGLSVVQQLVESFHGQIGLWSEPGQGTRFDIWLPACAAEAAPSAGN